MKSYKLIASALLAALAFALQFFNGILGIPTGFGMTVDLAAVPVIIALFVLGTEYSLTVLALLAVIILATSSTGYIGAVTKVGATLPMVLIPFFIGRGKSLRLVATGFIAAFLLAILLFAVSAEFAKMPGIEIVAGLAPLTLLLMLLFAIKNGGKVELGNPRLAVMALALAAIARGAVMTIANLYFAGPVFFHISPDEFIGMLDSLALPLFGAGMGWFVLFFWNLVQAVVEFAVAWVAAYHFGLVKRYSE
jgi:riboflavin transporter FmnP